jgi:Zn-dependent protease with chaperone function
MNFFEEQARARRKTVRLVVLMLLAVASLIVLASLITGLAWTLLQQYSASTHSYPPQTLLPFNQQFSQNLHSPIPLYAAFGVLVMVLGGGVFKLLTLHGPGCGVAEALGGRRVPASTQILNERKILNVVEEMAIASGNPVPAVYILNESGINAFAAGTHNRNAVIGISQGAIDLLNREELQGVVAHEFSHIHFGDMRLNIRLIAVLHGILMLSLIGSFLMRSTSHSSDKKAGGLFFVGVALWVLGGLGVFFGNIIKSAISRQREYLADASAVQFTRNPDGIANALRKIGGHGAHGLLEADSAEEFTHMYFDSGVAHWLGSLTDTHPPLEDRIKKILPRWDGSMIRPKPVDSTTVISTPIVHDPIPFAPSTPAHAMLEVLAAGALITGQQAVDQIQHIGNPNHQHLAQAKNVIASFSESIRTATQDPFSARALLFCILLETQNANVRTQQIEHLQKNCDEPTFLALKNLMLEFAIAPREHYLPLVELAIPSIKSLSEPQYQTFKQQMLHMVRLDGQISLLEWCFYRIITANYENKAPQGQLKVEQVNEDISKILLQLGQHGGTHDIQAAMAAAQTLLPNIQLNATVSIPLTINDLEKSVKRLEQLRPLEKPKLLKAIIKFIEHDGKITLAEFELVRALADCMGCPLPLFSLNESTAT